MPKKSKRKSRQRLITEFLSPKKIYGYDPKTECWHCVICGQNLGKSNSRQLCGKSYCYNE